MRLRKKIFIAVTFLAVALTLAIPNAEAKGNEFDTVCNHLKTKYQAKKVKIPFMWLARFAVGVVRPAGVKSFKVTTFRNLQFSPETLNDEMKNLMSNSFDENWTPIMRVRSQTGEQVYMNMREEGNNVKILVVTINKNEAVVVRDGVAGGCTGQLIFWRLSLFVHFESDRARSAAEGTSDRAIATSR